MSAPPVKTPPGVAAAGSSADANGSAQQLMQQAQPSKGPGPATQQQFQPPQYMGGGAGMPQQPLQQQQQQQQQQQLQFQQQQQQQRLRADGMNASGMSQSMPKSAYAKKVKNGEKPTTAPPPGVQSGSAPVEATGNYEGVNTGLEDEAPRMASFYRDTSRFYANLDHSSFVNEAYGRGSGWGGRGSMIGMGSMGGMGAMGSMMGPMGSMYGRPMGSMYGGGMGPMGSMYGRGMGPMGSMYMPGSMYASGYVSRPASLFGSMYSGNGGSMYGGQPGDGGMNAMGSMGPGGYGYGMGSMYNAPPNGSYAQPGQNSAYNPASAAQSAYGQSNSFYNPNPMQQVPGQAAGPTGMGASGDGPGAPGGFGGAPTPGLAQRSLPGAPGAAPDANGGFTAAGGTNSASPSTSKSLPIPAHVLLLESPGPNMVLRTDPSNQKCLLLGEQSRQVFVDELTTGANAPQVVMAWKQCPHFRGIIEHVAAGHNIAVIVANDQGPASQTASLQAVEAVLLEAISRVDAAVRADAPLGYADAQLFCASFKSATEVKDLVDGAASAYKTPEIGSHPLYGSSFMNMKSKVVPVGNDGAKAVVDMLQNVTPQLRAQDPVQVMQLIVKQVRNSTKTGSPDVLVSSVLAVINNAQEGGPLPTPYFGAARNESVVPASFLKSTLGGACSVMGVLSVSSTNSDASKATAALTSLMDLHSVLNSAPRSGSLVRFVNFARNESTKLASKPDANPSVVQKVNSMLKDGEELMANPRTVQPRSYPISHSGNKTNAPGSSPAQGGGGGGATSLMTGADDKADSNNPIRSTLIIGTVANAPQTLQVEADGKTITDLATGARATVTEVVTRAAEDWRTTESVQANELQAMFQNGNNTAIVGTVSPTEMNTLDKQPLWLSYKRMVSSLLSVASQKYTFAEVSLSMALIEGNELIADLFNTLEGDPAAAAQSAPKKLSVSFSPLSGPMVHKATIIKPPTPLQLESTINSALYQVPALLEKTTSGRSIIFASAVLKGVMENDVYNCSLIGASTLDPRVMLEIAQRKETVPHELFEYAFGGPCCTLFLGDVNQGDANVAAVIEVLKELSTRCNRTVRACSVKRFVAFAEGNLKTIDEKIAAAQSEKEKEVLMKGRKSMEVFHSEYKALLADPEHIDPKNYRRGGRNDDGTSIGSRDRKSADGTSVERKKRTMAATSTAAAGAPAPNAKQPSNANAKPTTSGGGDGKVGNKPTKAGDDQDSKDSRRKPNATTSSNGSGARRSSSSSKKK